MRWEILGDDTVRICVAAFLGGMLGFEREWKGHAAGLRTHMMVSIGCAVFVVAAVSVAAGHEQETITRVIQGIASGIGFLGAGTILKLDQTHEVKGLTTASSIWLSAALGVAAGLGEYALAVAATLVSLFVLAALGPAEKFLERRHKKRRAKHLPIDADAPENATDHV